MRRILLVIISTILSGCTSSPVEETPDTPVEGMAAFDKGMKALEQERYAESAAIFDKLLVSKPASELDLVTLFNSGASYDGLGNCPKAAERYREVVRSSAGKFQRVESEALYRLSLMYECQGQDTKAITALLDARKRGKTLPFATLHAEIPARLAAAYARLGNRTKALEYFALASQGLKKIVAQEDGRRQLDTMAKTLFLMGQLNPAQRRAEGDPVAFLQGLSMQQPYLLQAVETGHPIYAEKASADLLTAYDNIWKYKLADSEQQHQFYVRALQAVRELKRIRLPKEDARVNEVFAKLSNVESRLQNEMARAPETTRLTPDAEKREGLRREGRLVHPSAPKKKAPVKKR